MKTNIKEISLLYKSQCKNVVTYIESYFLSSLQEHWVCYSFIYYYLFFYLFIYLLLFFYLFIIIFIYLFYYCFLFIYLFIIR